MTAWFISSSTITDLSESGKTRIAILNAFLVIGLCYLQISACTWKWLLLCSSTNVFRNRWCGAYWASKGIRVVPTVNLGRRVSTFDFCFEGIEKGSVVAVSTYMAWDHHNRQDQKEWFMAGYNEMLRRIEPEKIICYNTPFPEM